jgi:hypothetical protein
VAAALDALALDAATEGAGGASARAGAVLVGTDEVALAALALAALALAALALLVVLEVRARLPSGSRRAAAAALAAASRRAHSHRAWAQGGIRAMGVRKGRVEPPSSVRPRDFSWLPGVEGAEFREDAGVADGVGGVLGMVEAAGWAWAASGPRSGFMATQMAVLSERAKARACAVSHQAMSMMKRSSAGGGEPAGILTLRVIRWGVGDVGWRVGRAGQRKRHNCNAMW